MRALERARGTTELTHCLIMGIVNRTPDSFYDGGRVGLQESVDHALRLVEEGADLLDIGTVRAGPGPGVDEDEETRRLLPLVEALAPKDIVPMSIETSRPAVARRALQTGAAIVNDVGGLEDPALADVCADAGAALVLMHNGGQIRGRPRHPRYVDVVAEVAADLQDLAERAVARGVRQSSLVVDPGLDFGKTTMHSLEIMRRIDELVGASWPVLIAASRKDVVGETLGLPVRERLEGSLALAALSAAAGVAIVRVHDVRASARVVAMVEAVQGRRAPVAPIRGLWE